MISKPAKTLYLTPKTPKQMIKTNYLLLFIFLLLLGSCNPEDIPSPLKGLTNDQIERYANSGARKLLQCCTRLGYKNEQITVDWDNTKVATNGQLRIPVRIAWKGGVSGINYFLEGRLTCNLDGCEARWQTDDYSRVPFFSGNCTNRCQLDCLK